MTDDKWEVGGLVYHRVNIVPVDEFLSGHPELLLQS